MTRDVLDLPERPPIPIELCELGATEGVRGDPRQSVPIADLPQFLVEGLAGEGALEPLRLSRGLVEEKEVV